MIGQMAQFSTALCAGAGAWLLTGANHRAGAARLRAALREPAPPPPRRWRRRPRWPESDTWGVLGCCVAAGALLALGGRSPLPLLAAVLATPLALRWWRRRRALQEAERRRDAVVDFCAVLAGEVRAGRPAGQALIASGPAELGTAAGALFAAARYGGDVPAALRSAARQPGAEGLGGVAACWEVAVEGGASLAAGLERVAAALRAERDQEEELRAQLAGPRASALVLAALPLFGLLLGASMGVAPLQVLLGTPLGFACLGAGALLEWAGVAWVGAIVRSAERAAR